MNAHWSDCLPWGAFPHPPHKTRRDYTKGEYERKLRTATLIGFDPNRSAADNLRRLEVGQGFQVLGKSQGFWSGSRTVPGRFVTCNRTLIIRTE